MLLPGQADERSDAAADETGKARLKNWGLSWFGKVVEVLKELFKASMISMIIFSGNVTVLFPQVFVYNPFVLIDCKCTRVDDISALFGRAHS